MKIRIEGYHGTCAGAAKNILAKGLRAADVRARAGAGVYFWAYRQGDGFARELARAWWKQKQGSGEYAKQGYKGADEQFALLHLAWEVESSEYFDFDTVRGLEYLRAAEERVRAVKAKAALPKDRVYTSNDVYNLAVKTLSGQLAKQSPPAQLKVLKVNMPPPEGFQLGFGGGLTRQVSGYIYLTQWGN